MLRLQQHVYYLTDPNYHDDEVAQLERDARAQYDRIRKKIERFFIDYDVQKFDPEEFIEQWLDESSLSFLGGQNPAFSASNRDRELNRLMYLIISEADPDGQFLRDLTSVALGDSLFRAIRAITEFETSAAELANIPTRMEGVEAYFDTRFVFRALGFGAEQFTHAAAELLQLCKSTGCKTFMFSHNLREIQRVIRTVADVMNYSGNIEGDIASYAYERGLSPGDLIDLASSIEERITACGLSVREPPPLTDLLSIDELGLDTQLRTDLRQATDDARIADVASLAAIYRLRGGAPKRFLEKCDAIFVTSNKGLADSSVKFFRKHFTEAGQQNTVQLCMTDVVFSTRTGVGS